jgi:hypothetical protein
MLKTLSNDRTLFRLVVVSFLVYAALFIYRTSFVIDGERFFSLFDDAMISMRYAKNLAHGFGLIWNPGGEAVQGYTNPLWVLYMSLIHLFRISRIENQPGDSSYCSPISRLQSVFCAQNCFRGFGRF